MWYSFAANVSCHQRQTHPRVYWKVMGVRSGEELRCPFPVREHSSQYGELEIRELCPSPDFEMWHSVL